MRLTIPFAGKPKARPRSSSSGNTHMPTDYMDWKEKVVNYVRLTGSLRHSMTGDVHVSMIFHADHVDIEVLPSMLTRPKNVRGDLDNLAGGMLDALQDAGLLPNDRHVVDLEASFPSTKEDT